MLFDMDCQVISEEVAGQQNPESARTVIATDRAAMSIPIRVSAFDEGRGEFVEDSHTTQVSAWGGWIVLKNWAYPMDVVRIVNLQNLFEADFRVVGLIRYPERGAAEWVVECLEKGRNIWGVEFPQIKPAEESKITGTMECVSCKTHEAFSLAPSEIDVLQSTGLIGNFCKTCDKPTYWTYADAHRRPPAFPPFEDLAPPPRVEKSSAFINTRAHRRLELQLPMVIRNEKGEEETSVTKNISRAGFATVLAMSLSQGDIVTFECAQFSGNQSIGLKAECRWAGAVTPGGTKHMYGFRTIQ